MLIFGSSKSCSASGLAGGAEAEVGESCGGVLPDIDTELYQAAAGVVSDGSGSRDMMIVV